MWLRFFCCFFIVLPLSAQKPKPAEKQFAFYDEDDQPASIRDFTWYRTEKLEKSGSHYPFAGYTASGAPYVYGSYSTPDSGGTRDGYFVYYDTISGQVRLEGLFQQGKKEGKWKAYYNGTQQLWYEEVFEKGEFRSLISYYQNGSMKREIKPGAHKDSFQKRCYDTLGREIKYTPFYEEARFPGGRSLLHKFIRRNRRYSVDCRKLGIKGMFRIRYTVDELGIVSVVEILQAKDPCMIESVTEIFRRMPIWKPLLIDDIPTKRTFTINIKF